MKLTPRKIFILAVGIFILVIILLASRMKQAKTSELSIPVEYGAEGFPVEIQKIALAELELSLTMTGTIRAQRDVYVAAETGGRIVSLPVELGLWIEREGLIAQIDSVPAQLTLNQAEAAVASAEANYEPAAKDLQRMRELHRQGDISQQTLDNAAMLERSLCAALNSAVAVRDLARKSFNDTRITAPFSGEVAELALEVGQLTAPGSPAVRLVDIDTVEVGVGLTPEELDRIKVGMEALIRLGEGVGAVYRGYIGALGPVASGDGTFPAEIVIPNQGKKLRPGMVAKIIVVYHRMESSLVIPRDAVINLGGENSVFVVEAGIASRREVALGWGDELQVAVTRGISAGDSLVVKGHTVLKEGAGVKVMN